MALSQSKRKAVISIFLVDDHPMVRRSLRLCLSLYPQLRVCGEAEGETGALEQIPRLRPDVAIIDLSLKQGSGLSLIQELRLACPTLKMLVHSMHDSPFCVAKAFQVGAHGYVSKGEAVEEIVRGIEAVMAGELFVCEALARLGPVLSSYPGSVRSWFPSATVLVPSLPAPPGQPRFSPDPR